MVTKKLTSNSADSAHSVVFYFSMCSPDIDECFAAAANFENLCESDPNTRCVNTEGSFQCLCVPGYFRNNSGMCIRSK